MENDKHFQEIVNSVADSIGEAFEYSGRNMFEKSCLGVKCSFPLATAVRITAGVIRELLESDTTLDTNEVTWHVHTHLSSRIAQEAFDKAYVLYWPNIPWANQSLKNS